MKRLAVAAIAAVGILSAVPASAEEVGVGVGVGPVGAGVTVGSAPLSTGASRGAMKPLSSRSVAISTATVTAGSSSTGNRVNVSILGNGLLAEAVSFCYASFRACAKGRIPE